MIAVGRHLVFAGSDNGYAVLAHQSAHASVPNIQADLLQLFGHPWPAVAAQAETGLFFDMCQCDQVRPLSAAGGTAAEGAQPARADTDNLAQAIGGKYLGVLR